MDDSADQPSNIFHSLYSRATEIADREKTESGRPDVLDHEFPSDKELFARIRHQSLIARLSKAITQLTEFKDLERELLPLGLGIQIAGTISGGRFTEELKGEWRATVSLAEMFNRLGIYYDILAHEEPSKAWARIKDAIHKKPITAKYFLGLHGCDFQSHFDY